MVRTMSIIVAFMLATALAQATQQSSGGECPSDDKPKSAVSLLQMNLQISKDGGEDTSSGTGGELGKMGGSTCFHKGVDVFYGDSSRYLPIPIYGDSFADSAICKQSGLKHEFNALSLRYYPDSRTLCIIGNGIETRAISTVHMIKDAVRILDKDCKSLSLFEHKAIHIYDADDCSHDMAYSVKRWRNGCKTKLIPDFAFYKWEEAGLLPDYKRLTPLLASLGSHPPTEGRCGWAGNMLTNPTRYAFARDFKHSALIDIVTPEWNQGAGGEGGRISMEDQVKRWACFVELKGNGYSGRVPYLMQSGRPILMVGEMGTVWFSHLLKPWVHYIPVLQDMSDLAEKAKFALGITPGSNATKIAAAAQEFAQTHLSYDAAINYMANSLLEVSQAS